MLSLNNRATSKLVVLLFICFRWALTRVLQTDNYYSTSQINHNKQNDNRDLYSDNIMENVNYDEGWIDYFKYMPNNDINQLDDIVASYILRFSNSESTLRKAKLMCAASPEEFRTKADELNLKAECYLGIACDYVFENAFVGMSGKFKLSQLRQFVSECFQDEIDYIEMDRKVAKSQGQQSVTPYPPYPSPIVYLSPQSEKYEFIMGRIDNSLRNNMHAYYIGKQRSDIASYLDDIGNETASFLNEFDVMFSEVQQQGQPLIRAMSASEGGQDQGVGQGQGQEQEYVSPKGTKRQEVVPGLWNLDRIDQDYLPLDGGYKFGAENYVGTGRGVTVYVLDSGIRQSHIEFMNMAMTRSRARIGADFVDWDDQGYDCDGHGTHVASTAVGRAVGIAKEAEVVGVRVLDCFGQGSVSNVLKAIDWVAQDRRGPAVVALSLGVEAGTWSLALEQEIHTLIEEHNITVTVASGNMGTDSCSISPANVNSTITVGASNLESKFSEIEYKEGSYESIYQYSNTGACVDLFAPGVDIYGACGGFSENIF
eukprot:TRINITY_DN6918_c2_g1_i7.p1 TRINITY_DN6918_c2_g1~~TRINITY_DN6918_c2_g1_i7.p1  ORF type:complete len:540 (+),score=83.13 TRINITY_DN6918_c2_g1_i7:75-1694(+)